MGRYGTRHACNKEGVTCQLFWAWHRVLGSDRCQIWIHKRLSCSQATTSATGVLPFTSSTQHQRPQICLALSKFEILRPPTLKIKLLQRNTTPRQSPTHPLAQTTTPKLDNKNTETNTRRQTTRCASSHTTATSVSQTHPTQPMPPSLTLPRTDTKLTWPVPTQTATTAGPPSRRPATPAWASTRVPGLPTGG